MENKKEFGVVKLSLQYVVDISSNDIVNMYKYNNASIPYDPKG